VLAKLRSIAQVGITKDTQLMKKKVDCRLSLTAFLLTLRSKAIVRPLLATNDSQRDLQPAKSSPFKVLLSLRKVVHFRNFLRTWLSRRLSLVGADTSNETGHFQTQVLVNQKKEILG
jgi:hypothetical protein